MENKKKVGVFTLTCDEGCSIYLIEIFNNKLLEWLEKIKIDYFLSVKDKVEIRDFDIALIEGVVSTEKDLKDVEEVRRNTKILIAMGNCAITGQPSGQRNFFTSEQKEAIKPHLDKFKFLPECRTVKECVKVDDEIAGCPIDEKKFIEVFEKYL